MSRNLIMAKGGKNLQMQSLKNSQKGRIPLFFFFGVDQQKKNVSELWGAHIIWF